ncbi:MAG TPA: ankyrin repeat domain-containing protein [Candidatus Limnocylindrales bacterium]|nr:ankyrin repeat domain-containing protein [Candidatus Limnocylindrales bacterium]
MLSWAFVAAAMLVPLTASAATKPAKEMPAPKPEEISEVKAILRSADLLVACEDGNTDKVRQLLKEGVDPNASRTSGANALLYATAGRHSEIVSLLLDAKADPNRTSAGLSPLFLASENGDIDTVKLLLRAGANVNLKLHAVDEDLKPREGDTALIAAASSTGTAAVVKALLGAGADIDEAADNGKTAVMQAVASGNSGVLRALLEARPKLSARMTDEDSDFDALTLAVGKSNPDMVGMLIDAGADPRVKMDDEVTLLEFAILSEQPVVASKLRKAGIPEPSAERIAALRKAATETGPEH